MADDVGAACDNEEHIDAVRKTWEIYMMTEARGRVRTCDIAGDETPPVVLAG